jgi:hypothetical protein
MRSTTKEVWDIRLLIRARRLGKFFQIRTPSSILVNECIMYLEAYYRGFWRMVWGILSQKARIFWATHSPRALCLIFVVRLYDKLGKTELRADGRHAKGCTYQTPSEEFDDCLDKLLPKWLL